ncbi:phytanoyl-CoA dioxygenase [Legionella rubrilucens]|uniref:Phytanoyl-CoA dioxygenase n=1 Tax=Legionella rubrilucens TaxID=458 RepID=A0A0W0XQ34_9GAMM|nr:phytanoyl-CoA dioxygenase family protein [Legionella rubrilucens]KTD46746.1 phytanoyl-CoA dioxygenase [Legionella rubrilucens]
MDLSPVQIDDFLTQGYLVIEDFFSKETCDQLMRRMNHLIAENKDLIPAAVFSTRTNEHAASDYFLESGDKIHFFFEPDAFHADGTLTHPIEHSLNKVGHALHELDPVFRHYSHDSRIHSICRQLGFKTPCLLQSMYLFKQPAIGAEVNCHQDATYLHSEQSDVLGFWFALEDATLENGCLQVIPSPHTVPLKQKMIRENDRIYFEEYDKTPWRQDYCVPLEVRQGSLILLHGHVPHKSEANVSSKSRHAYTLHAIDASYPYPQSNWLQRASGLPVWPEMTE